jgi:hypothetical protein
MTSNGAEGSPNQAVELNDFDPEREETEKNMKTPRNIETTLGDLIAAASEVAFEYSNNDVEAYHLARLALVEILKKSSQSVDLDKEFESLDSASQLIH